MFKSIGILEIIIVVTVLMILFGGKKLHELSNGLIEAIKEFRKAFRGEDKKDQDN